MELKTFFAQDLAGNVIANPEVTLYLPGTATLATGLKNAAGSPLSNPFTGGSMGQIVLAAPDGNYDMKIAGGGRELVMRVRFNSASDTAVAASISATASAGAALDAANTAAAARDDAVAAQLAAAELAEAASNSADAAAQAALQAGQFIPSNYVRRLGAGQALPTSDIGPLWHQDYGGFLYWQEIGTFEGYASARLGEVTFRAAADPLPGTLVADGSDVSRTTYAALFAAIGTEFGVGDGSTTFTLPDLQGEHADMLPLIFY